MMHIWWELLFPPPVYVQDMYVQSARLECVRSVCVGAECVKKEIYDIRNHCLEHMWFFSLDLPHLFLLQMFFLIPRFLKFL